VTIPRVRVKISGPFACFTRPETKVERVSYPVITPSAARNILDAICWRPEMRWIVTSISVLKPICYISVLRNEVQSKLSPGSIKKWMTDPAKYEPMAAGAGANTEGTPRNSVLLRDIAYIVEAFPLVFDTSGDNTPVKYVSMLQRRVEKGQCYHRPALGCREFAADFAPPAEHDRPLPISADFGRMLYDIAFLPEGNRASFFEARLENGVMDTRPEVVLKDDARRQEVLQCSYKR
jgi:CRISPR-associated protein Cas5d